MSSTPLPPDPVHRRKKLRLEASNYADPNRVYFVTLCSRHLAAPFSRTDLAKAVVEALVHQHQAGHATIYAYVLMPDHLHVILSPAGECKSLSRLLADFKSYTTHVAWKYGIRGALWQRSFYDHIVRREESMKAICEYVLSNPVRKGLVADVGQWPYAGMTGDLPIV